MGDNVVILDADGALTIVGADEVTSRNGATVPAEKVQREKVGFGGDGVLIDVSAATPLPVTDTAIAITNAALTALQTELNQKLEASDLANLSTIAKQDAIKNAVDAVTAKLTSDPATQTTLAAVLTKLSSDPSTGAKQDTQATKLDTLIGKDYATSAKQDSLKTSTDAITTKLTSDPSTAANQTSANTKLDTLHTDNGGPGSSPPSLAGSGSGVIGYLRNVLDALRGTLTISGAVTQAVPADQVGTLTDSRKTVTTPGTAVAIVSSSTPCKWVTVTALTSNMQQVNVGGSGVLASSGSSTGTPLLFGEAITIPVSNANLVFVDARVAGEGVSFTVAS